MKIFLVYFVTLQYVVVWIYLVLQQMTEMILTYSYT